MWGWGDPKAQPRRGARSFLPCDTGTVLGCLVEVLRGCRAPVPAWIGGPGIRGHVSTRLAAATATKKGLGTGARPRSTCPWLALRPPLPHGAWHGWEQAGRQQPSEAPSSSLVVPAWHSEGKARPSETHTFRFLPRHPAAWDLGQVVSY